jgi:membrane protease YdiL (CAAX protease family)
MENKTFLQKLWFSLKMYGLELFCIIFFAYLNTLFFDNQTGHKPPMKGKELEFIFGALLLAPLLEELAFRYILIQFSSKKHLIITTVTILVLMLMILLKKSKLDFRHLILIIWLTVIYVSYFLNKKYQFEQKMWFYFGIILFSAFMFSIIHKESYTFNIKNLSFITAFLILFVNGLILTRVRIKSGIGWSMFNHFLGNLLPALGILLNHLGYLDRLIVWLEKTN